MFRSKKFITYLILLTFILQVCVIGLKFDVAKSSAKVTSKPKTFTAWWGLYSPTAAKYFNSDNSTVLAWQEYFKRTGVKIKFIHPPVGQETDSFRLMIASNEIPDLIYSSITSQGSPLYPSGWDQAIKDKVIIRLNDLVDKNMPNLKKILQSNPTIKKDITSDEGNVYFLPLIQYNWLPWGGLQVRQDWLDELGLKEPITYDDWYKMLKLFKQKKGAVMQLLSAGYHMYDLFTAGYGIGTGFYQVKGKVKYGFIESGFLQYLTMMNKWYKEGLIEKDFYAKRQYFPDDNSIVTGKYGAWVTRWAGSYYKMLAKDSKFDIAAVSPPVKKAGEKVHLGKLTVKPMVVDTMGLFITTRCKEPVIVAKFFDYMFTKQGELLRNFGIEGKTFTYVNGKPVYTNLITSIQDMNNKYKYVIFNSPGITGRIATDLDAFPNLAKEYGPAINKWKANDMAMELPDWLVFTSDENSKLSKIMADVNTFTQETIPKFIIGQLPLSKYNSYFVNKLKALKIEEAIKIYQNAYNRYLNR